MPYGTVPRSPHTFQGCTVPLTQVAKSRRFVSSVSRQAHGQLVAYTRMNYTTSKRENFLLNQTLYVLYMGHLGVLYGQKQ